MPVGGTQRSFADLARADGIELGPQSVAWLNRRGHLGLTQYEDHSTVIKTLERIYLSLGGDLAVLDSARPARLRGDFIHPPTNTLIEIDESQHFTSFRLLTLQMYPPDVPLGFDFDDYVATCEKWYRKSDRYFRDKAARGFGIGGRQRQRAYYDALRDLATPLMGYPPLVRIEAADRDPVDAYRRHRLRLCAALGLAR